MFDARVEVDSEELQKYLSKIYRNLKTLKPFFVAIIPVLHGSIVANFREGGRPKKWKPLKPSTIAGRMREGTWPGFHSAQPILMAHGTLFKSIGTVRKIGTGSLEYGTNLEKATYLQYGTKKMPARPFVLFQDEDIEQIVSYAAAFAFDPETAKTLI